MNTPWDHYQADLDAKRIEANPEQEIIIRQLQVIYQDYCHWQLNKASVSQKLKSLFITKQKQLPLGLYLWGGVGIGKTYLMDLFYGSLPEKRKQRLHFHQFMRTVHRQLQRLQGTANPLQIIANDFAKTTDILCFDEFMVHEIADAMLLGGLLDGLFKAGIVLIATSNVEPKALYENGLHRELFLPTIDLLHQHCQVVHCHTKTDYRLQHIKRHGVYFSPLGTDSDQQMAQTFADLTSHRGKQDQSITIADRVIATRGLGSEVIWFDFSVLCTLGRSKNEYADIAATYHTVLLSNVPTLQPEQIDKVIFFMHLVDILYDDCVNLIIQADGPIEAIYPAGAKAKEFARTQSRLHEMQSDAYLHRRHTF